MIEFTKSFKVGDQVFATLEEAQVHELGTALGNEIVISEDLARAIVKNKQAVMDILTTTATSRPKARRLHGGKKTRKAEPAPAT